MKLALALLSLVGASSNKSSVPIKQTPGSAKGSAKGSPAKGTVDVDGDAEITPVSKPVSQRLSDISEKISTLKAKLANIKTMKAAINWKAPEDLYVYMEKLAKYNKAVAARHYFTGAKPALPPVKYDDVMSSVELLKSVNNEGLNLSIEKLTGIADILRVIEGKSVTTAELFNGVFGKNHSSETFLSLVPEEHKEVFTAIIRNNVTARGNLTDDKIAAASKWLKTQALERDESIDLYVNEVLPYVNHPTQPHFIWTLTVGIILAVASIVVGVIFKDLKLYSIIMGASAGVFLIVAICLQVARSNVVKKLTQKL
jgi:hypothetical protein